MASEDLFNENADNIISTLEEEQSQCLEVQISTELEETHSEKPNKTPADSKLFQLPMSKIRNIMKLDTDVQVVPHEAVYVVTRATELFIQSLAREAFTYTASSKKKTVQKQDVELAIAAVDSLLFLDGAMDF